MLLVFNNKMFINSNTLILEGLRFVEILRDIILFYTVAQRYVLLDQECDLVP